jgi:hypothetical protein
MPYILPIVDAQDAPDVLLGAQIEQLIDDGTLNRGQGNALLNKLSVAIKKLDQEKDKVAINLLHALINQVSEFVADGILTPAEGQPLIDAANQIIATLGG